MNPAPESADMLSTESTFRTSENVTLTEMQNGEAVLLDLDTWKYYSLNETGVHVWKSATDGAQLSEIATSMSERWEVSPEEALSAATRLLSDLVTEKLIDVKETSDQ